MKKILSVLVGALVLSACAKAPDRFLSEHDTIDLFIENGRIIDGLGNAPVAADLVVVDDEIVFVGDSSFSEQDFEQRIARRIDAEGRVVAPGFIDLHSHGNPLKTPAFENFVAMGVTTITLGQDGSSVEVPDIARWLDTVAQQGTGPNLAMFVGHGTLRRLSGIGRKEVPGEEALQLILAMLDTSLEHTFGMSTGLEYNPGLNARAEELQALARVVGRKQRMIMSHMRNEDDTALEASIAELLAHGRHAPVHISHLKSVHGKGAKRADEILALLDTARADGSEITADIYPYSASYSGISLLFPVWAKTSEQFAVAAVERREELESYLRNRVLQRNGPQATLLGSGPYSGKTLAQVADELEMPFEKVLIDKIGPGGASAAYFVMDDELQARLLADPHVGICSDGSPGGSHPRGHGAFAKVIEQYVEKEGALSLPEAIRKMTSLPAQILGMTDRGSIAPGNKADLIIFDPAKVAATATYTHPRRQAQGFDVVIVNGSIARENGELDTALHGRVLKPQPISR